MAECVALARQVGATVAEPLRRAGLSVRRGRRTTRAGETSKTSGAASSKGWRRRWRQARWASRLRAPRAPSLRGCRRHRRAHAAHRLQHQPGHRPARRRQEDRRRDSPQQRRLPLRQGAGFMLEDRGHRPGVDEPDELREDADLPGVRAGQARSRAIRRVGARERNRRAGSGGGARCQSAEFYLQLERFGPDQMSGKQAAR